MRIELAGKIRQTSGSGWKLALVGHLAYWNYLKMPMVCHGELFAGWYLQKGFSLSLALSLGEGGK